MAVATAVFDFGLRKARFRVLGVHVNAVEIIDVIAEMERWIAAREGCHFVACTGMHGITETQLDPSFKRILDSADLVVADGMPLVWLGRSGVTTCAGVFTGRELLEMFCCNTGAFLSALFLRWRAGCGGARGGEIERNATACAPSEPTLRPFGR